MNNFLTKLPLILYF